MGTPLREQHSHGDPGGPGNPRQTNSDSQKPSMRMPFYPHSYLTLWHSAAMALVTPHAESTVSLMVDRGSRQPPQPAGSHGV